MPPLKIGFALCGSFCTFSQVLPVVEQLCAMGHEVFPILSENAASIDTRFGKADDFIQRLERCSGHTVMRTIQEAEPIGPKNFLDILIIAPCTGNTLGKLAGGITDSTVTMAAKANLRNGKPVLIAVSTNDGLSASAKNIGLLLNTKNIYFVPLGQDDHVKKPTSLVADFSQISDAMHAALEHRQLQPILVQK